MLCETIKRTAFKITRVGQLVAQEASRRLGIPFGMRTARRGMGIGIVMALLTFFGYYVFMAMGLALGKDRAIYAWIDRTFSDPPLALEALAFLAGWFPAIFFLCLAFFLLRRQQ